MRELEILTSVARSLATNQSPEALGEQIVAWSQVLLPGGAARLWLLDATGTSRQLVASIGLEQRADEQRLRSTEGMGSHATRDVKIVVSEDVRVDPRFVKKEWARREGLVASIMLPLVHREQVYGNIAIFLRRRHEFSAEQVSVLESFAAMAASAFASASLFRQAQRQTERLRGLNRVITSIAGELDTQTVLANIVEEAIKLLDLDGGGLRMKRGDQLERVHCAGISRLTMAHATVSIEDSLSGHVVTQDGPIAIVDLGADSHGGARPLDAALVANAVSWLGVPVRYGGRVTGVLQGACSQRRRFTDEDIALFTALADQAAVAIENARLFEELQSELAEKSAVELALRQHHDQLEELVTARTEELEDTQDMLLRKERLATLGQLTGSVAHELRTPLGTIDASLRVIDKGEANLLPRTRRALERGLRNIDRCVKIMEELLHFARAPALTMLPVPLGSWLAALVADEPHLGQVKLLGEDGAQLLVTMDEGRMRRAILNLVENALQAHAEIQSNAGDTGHAVGTHSVQSKPPAVTLSWRDDGADAVVEVRDDGPGIPSELHERIFEPLFTTKGFGIGLGLSIVRRIIEQHGGSIRLESSPGDGTRMIVRIPKHTEAGTQVS